MVTVLVTVFLARADFRWLALARPAAAAGRKFPANGAIWLALTYGSDGTRTRDLRRDRPRRSNGRSTTISTNPLQSRHVWDPTQAPRPVAAEVALVTFGPLLGHETGVDLLRVNGPTLRDTSSATAEAPHVAGRALARTDRPEQPLVRALAHQRDVMGGCPAPRPEPRACPPSAAALLARLGVELPDKQAVQVACEVPTGRGRDANDLQLLVLAQCSGPCHQPQGSVF